MDNVDTYLKLVERVLHNPSDREIAALEAYERANPSVVDDAYRRGRAADPDPTVRVNS
jgi:hypothetical protein